MKLNQKAPTRILIRPTHHKPQATNKWMKKSWMGSGCLSKSDESENMCVAINQLMSSGYFWPELLNSHVQRLWTITAKSLQSTVLPAWWMQFSWCRKIIFPSHRRRLYYYKTLIGHVFVVENWKIWECSTHVLLLHTMKPYQDFFFR